VYVCRVGTIVHICILNLYVKAARMVNPSAAAAKAGTASLPKLRYLSAWFCPYAHRATIALEHHAGRVEYEWVEVCALLCSRSVRRRAVTWLPRRQVVVRSVERRDV
jgi:hypothetical protein